MTTTTKRAVRRIPPPRLPTTPLPEVIRFERRHISHDASTPVPFVLVEAARSFELRRAAFLEPVVKTISRVVPPHHRHLDVLRVSCSAINHLCRFVLDGNTAALSSHTGASFVTHSVVPDVGTEIKVTMIHFAILVATHRLSGLAYDTMSVPSHMQIVLHGCDVDVTFVDIINRLVLMTPFDGECYKMCESIDDDVTFCSAYPWYEKLLACLACAHRTTLEEASKIDQLLRQQRARGHSFVLWNNALASQPFSLFMLRPDLLDEPQSCGNISRFLEQLRERLTVKCCRVCF